ncbi:hypothetical protein MTR67_027330 [Solanum verrucosum]|uniref:Methyltransferase n=1 Tax=Solanum verrucosum TaxID=315347 RepID=A0AAF0R781_SOLVR|nr:hypothetical protein MTR67_027330 [Solanum verrucosum]
MVSQKKFSRRIQSYGKEEFLITSGFAANLVNDHVWVMNIVPVEAKVNTLGAIYERELIGTYQSCQVIESQGQPQTCLASLGNLNVCSPFVLPGPSNMTPSTECCAALQ